MNEEQNIRELSLVVFGAILGGSDETRKRLLGTLPSGIMCQDLDICMDAIRTRKSAPIRDWLRTRNAIWEKGQDYLQAMCQTILTRYRDQEVQKIIAQLNYVKHLGDAESIKMKLRECLDQLEKL